MNDFRTEWRENLFIGLFSRHIVCILFDCLNGIRFDYRQLEEKKQQNEFR
jgi:hypothetical protein